MLIGTAIIWSEEYQLQLDGTVTVTLLSPEDNSQYTYYGAAQTLPLSVRVEGGAIPSGIQVKATLSDTAGQVQQTLSLNGEGGYWAGQMNMPATAGDYNIRAEVLDSQGSLLSSTRNTLTVVDAQSIPVQVERIDPVNDAQGVEPNTFITVYFNRPIDVSQFAIQAVLWGHPPFEKLNANLDIHL